MIVGGPQYRVGSHRQFVLLARSLASAGYPVMRFDYRSMGDSEGDSISFEDIAPDIEAAVSSFFEHHSECEELVLWGLCDAASAILLVAHQIPQVSGVVLLNPWVRSDAGMARTYLRHYYLRRLFDPELIRKIRRGDFHFRKSFRSLISNLRSAWTRQSPGSDPRKSIDLQLEDRSCW